MSGNGRVNQVGEHPIINGTKVFVVSTELISLFRANEFYTLNRLAIPGFIRCGNHAWIIAHRLGIFGILGVEWSQYIIGL